MENVSLYEYMRVGIVHFMAYPECMSGEGPVVETITKLAEDPFFNFIEITHIKDPKARQEVKAILETSGMGVAYAAQPIVFSNQLNLNAFDDEERRQAVDRIKECIEEAAEIGAESIALVSGPDPGEDRRPEASLLLARSLKEICDEANGCGLGVALETFDRTIDKKALIGPTDEAADLAEKVNRANFGLMLDLSHLPLQHEMIYPAIKTAGKHLIHAHIGNCVLSDPNHPAYGDQHPHFGIEGGENGVEELAEFLQTLTFINYLEPSENSRVVSFEVRPQPGQSSEVVIANAKRTLIKAWTRI